MEPKHCVLRQEEFKLDFQLHERKATAAHCMFSMPGNSNCAIISNGKSFFFFRWESFVCKMRKGKLLVLQKLAEVKI